MSWNGTLNWLDFYLADRASELTTPALALTALHRHQGSLRGFFNLTCVNAVPYADVQDTIAIRLISSNPLTYFVSSFFSLLSQWRACF